jgi:hypothetical protein
VASDNGNTSMIKGHADSVVKAITAGNKKAERLTAMQ